MKTAILLLLFASLRVVAEEKVKVPPGYEPMNLFAENEVLQTKESFVIINGKKFRKIEYQSKIFYLRLLEDPNSEASELICDSDARKMNETPLIEGSVRVTARARLFIEGLRRGCQEVQGGRQITLSPDIRLGFLLDENPKDKLKNKKLFLNPATGVGFSGDW